MPNTKANDVILNKQRLRVLRELALVQGDAETAYDKVTILASKIIKAPVSLVSMVAADYQFFKSFVGLPEPWASRRQTPLSHSFCQHVVATNEPLIVTDAREHPLVHDNLAIPDLNVIGYAGIPITLSDGRRLGSFCVIDSEPREWTKLELDILRELALIVTYEIDLKARSQDDDAYKAKLVEAHQQLDRFINNIEVNEILQEDFLAEVREAREKFFTLDDA